VDTTGGPVAARTARFLARRRDNHRDQGLRRAQTDEAKLRGIGEKGSRHREHPWNTTARAPAGARWRPLAPTLVDERLPYHVITKSAQEPLNRVNSKITNLRQVLEVEFASLDPKGVWGFPATFERWKEDAMQGNQYTVGMAEGPAEQFRRRTQKWWDKIEQVRAAILATGNPISKARQQRKPEHNQRAD